MFYFMTLVHAHIIVDCELMFTIWLDGLTLKSIVSRRMVVSIGSERNGQVNCIHVFNMRSTAVVW